MPVERGEEKKKNLRFCFQRTYYTVSIFNEEYETRKGLVNDSYAHNLKNTIIKEQLDN